MLRELSVLSSRFSFSNTNYNYDNTNTNVSSHLCNYCSINPAHTAKNNNELKSVGTSGENDLKKAKAPPCPPKGGLMLEYEEN
jgi:hypothetical protein